MDGYEMEITDAIHCMDCFEGLRRIPEKTFDMILTDPPYRNTEKYGNDKESFDHELFYDWLRTRDFPVYVSEYSMPEDFAAITGIRHRTTLSASNNSKITVEKLFVHKRFARNLNQIFPL